MSSPVFFMKVKQKLDVFGHFSFSLLLLAVISAARRAASKEVGLIHLDYRGGLVGGAGLQPGGGAAAAGHGVMLQPGAAPAGMGAGGAAYPGVGALLQPGGAGVAQPGHPALGQGPLPISRTSTTATRVFLFLTTAGNSSWAPSASQVLRACQGEGVLPLVSPSRLRPRWTPAPLRRRPAAAG